MSSSLPELRAAKMGTSCHVQSRNKHLLHAACCMPFYFPNSFLSLVQHAPCHNLLHNLPSKTTKRRTTAVLDNECTSSAAWRRATLPSTIPPLIHYNSNLCNKVRAVHHNATTFQPIPSTAGTLSEKLPSFRPRARPVSPYILVRLLQSSLCITLAQWPSAAAVHRGRGSFGMPCKFATTFAHCETERVAQRGGCSTTVFDRAPRCGLFADLAVVQSLTLRVHRLARVEGGHSGRVRQRVEQRFWIIYRCGFAMQSTGAPPSRTCI